MYIAMAKTIHARRLRNRIAERFLDQAWYWTQDFWASFYSH